MADEFAPYMREVADRLLGKPTTATKRELRYGSHGSMAVDLGKGTWFSHEDNEGGGVLDLIQRHLGLRGAEAIDWMRENVGADLPDQTPREKTGVKSRRSISPAPKNGSSGASHAPAIVASYIYRDELGDPVYRVIRLEPKSFRQQRYDAAKGQFFGGAGCMEGVELLPYRLDEWLAETGTVYVVEGEKDADLLWSIGLPATCNPGGAGKWPESFGRYFQGRDVVIIPDNDEAGRKHAGLVAGNLTSTATSTRVLELPDLPPKGDVSDWLADHQPADFELVAASAQAIDAATLKLLADGKTAPEPFRYITHEDLVSELPLRSFLVEEWIPCGCVSSIYGSGGTGKSFLALMLAMCVASGRAWLTFKCETANVLAVMCEDDEEEIKRRRNKIARSLGIVQSELSGRLNIVARVGEENALMEFPQGVATRTPLFERIVAEAKRLMARLIILDNAAQLFHGNENDRAQVTAFLNSVAGIARQTDGAVVLLGHPPKTMNVEFSGSTAWDAVVRSRIWFKRLDEDESEDAPIETCDRYSLELVKSNYAKRFGIELKENAHGVVEYAGELTKRKALKISNDVRGFNILRSLFETHRRAIAEDEIVAEAIRIGVLGDCEQGSAAWRDKRRIIRGYMNKHASKIDARGDGSYALKP